ncbi:MAG: glycosyltransferase family 4 protein [Candidatus Altiarchaeota archaeon]
MGGIPNFISEFSKNALTQGHDIVVITSKEKNEPEREVVNDVEIYRIPIIHSKTFRRVIEYRSFGIRAQKLLKKLKKELNFDLVLGISFGAYAGLGHKLVYRSGSTPISLEVEMWNRLYPSLMKRIATYVKFYPQYLLEAKCIKNANGFLCQSKGLWQEFKKEYSIENKPVHIPCTGVDIKKFQSSDGSIIREKYNFNDKTIISFIGGFSIVKGAGFIEEALPEIFKIHPDVRFMIVGQMQYNLKLPHKYSNYIISVGNVPREHIPKYYAASDLYLYPSLNEGFPNTILEAMASGLPIIISDIIGVEEYLTNNKDALIIPRYSSDEIVNAVSKLIESEKLRRELGKTAKKTAKRYDWKIVTREIFDFFESVL